MPAVRSYKDLIVWQRSIELVQAVYDLTRSLPTSEQYGMTAQMRRAVVSIPANLAEGYGRATQRDFANFLSIARGSLMETEALLSVGERLGFFSGDQSQPARATLDEVSKMLSSLRKRVSARETLAPVSKV